MSGSGVCFRMIKESGKRQIWLHTFSSFKEKFLSLKRPNKCFLKTTSKIESKYPILKYPYSLWMPVSTNKFLLI